MEMELENENDLNKNMNSNLSFEDELEKAIQASGVVEEMVKENVANGDNSTLNVGD